MNLYLLQFSKVVKLSMVLLYPLWTNVAVATAPAPPPPTKASVNAEALEYPYPLFNNLMLLRLENS